MKRDGSRERNLSDKPEKGGITGEKSHDPFTEHRSDQVLMYDLTRPAPNTLKGTRSEPE